MREVQLNEEEGIATVIVHDQQLSLAIGKEGQNARLAARLTGWRIDIRSENEGRGRGRRRGLDRRRRRRRRDGRAGARAARPRRRARDRSLHRRRHLVEETTNVVRDDEGHEVHIEEVVVMDEGGAELEILEVDVTEDEA